MTLEVEKTFRNGDVDSIPGDIQSELVCNICAKMVLSLAGFASQLISHENQLANADHVNVLPDTTAGYLSQVCENLKGLALD